MLKQIINNCLLFEPERRPSFVDIVKYLETVEAHGDMDKNQFVNNL
jgi:hypothetical protein